MTVSSDLNRISYTGNGTTTVFPVNYYFLQNEHLQVILISATGTETPQTLTANYTVTGAGNEAGGTVTMLVAPPTGTTLVIQREVPATQETDYLANDPFPAESHERALDKLTMLVQQNERESDRALKIPLAAVQTTSTEMPLPQANRLLAWDQDGTAIRNFDPGTEFINVVGQQNSFADTFTGDGATTVFTLSGEPGSVANLDVSINGVTQVPSEDYTLSGNTLTFTTAPPAVASRILARFTEVYAEGAPNAGEVTFTGFKSQTGNVQDLADDDGSNWIGFESAGTGAVAMSVQDKLRETVSVKDFGAVGDGVTDDTAAIQAAYAAHKNLFFPSGVYIIAPTTTKTPTGFGRSLYYLLEITSNTSFIGETSATIKLKDNFSTDVDPKECPMFIFETGIFNFKVENLIFDYNKDNNPISPNRGAGVYNRFRNQVVMGWRAGCQDFLFKNNTIKNVNGVNCVVLAEPLSGDSISEKRAIISNNTFSNVGFDTDDHSSIVTYQQGTIIDSNIFFNGSLPPSAANAVELHNKDCVFSNSQVFGGGYYRGFYAASNLNTDVSNLIISGNNFNVETIGATILTNDDHDGVENVVIDGNNFFVNANIPSTASPTLTHSILQIRNQGTDSSGFLRNIVISNNTMGYAFPSATTTRLRHGIFLRHSGSPAPATRNISIYGNTIRYCSHGVDIDLNPGDGLLDSIVINNNTFEHMTSQHGGDGVGIYFNPDSLSPTKYANFSNNSFFYLGSTPNEFDEGISIRQAIEHIRIDGNDFYGVDTKVQNNSFNQVELYGSELRTGFTSAPSYGTWQQGDIVYRGNTSAGGTVGWVCVASGSPGTWKTFGAISA